MNNPNGVKKIIQISKPNPQAQGNNQNIQKNITQQNPQILQNPQLVQPHQNPSPIKGIIKPYVAPPIKIDFPENPTEDDKKNLVQRFNNSISEGKSDEAMEIMFLIIKNDIRVRE